MKSKQIIFTAFFLATATFVRSAPHGSAIPVPSAPHGSTIPVPSAPSAPSVPSVPSSTPLIPSSPNQTVPSTTVPPLPKETSPSDVNPSSVPLSPEFSQLKAALPDDIKGDFGKLTPECLNAMFSIVISPEFLKCVPLTALVPLLPVVTDPKSALQDPINKLIPPLEQFSEGICAVDKCSDEGNQKAIETLQKGCAADLKSGSKLANMAFSAAVFYSPIRDIVCLKDGKKDFCLVESLTTIFKLPKAPFKVIDGGLVDSIALADPSGICTNCNKGIITTGLEFVKTNDLGKQILTQMGVTQEKMSLLIVGVDVKCGINFLGKDGIPPSPPSPPPNA